jgi:hypothetical protein
MRRITMSLLLLLALLACVPALASARRGAHGRQKAAILQAAGFGRHAPLKCYDVYTSTVDGTWATATFGGSIKGVCLQVASNGVTVVHFKHGRWHFVTSGSSFGCPIPGHIPPRVQHDLRLGCVPGA